MSLAAVRARVRAACEEAGRDPASVRLVVVSKGHGPSRIRQAVLDEGHSVLAENRVQEWRSKAAELPPEVEWHFVGSLQRNKVKYLAAGRVRWVHSLNSIRLADAMEAQGARHGHRFRALVEVNTSGEASKQGIEPERAEGLTRHVQGLAHVEAAGLMTMAPHADDPECARPTFARLRALRDALGVAELSMGMSTDLEVAIAEGATIVRVGTAVFAEDG